MIADTPDEEMEMNTENAPQVEMVSDEMVEAASLAYEIEMDGDVRRLDVPRVAMKQALQAALNARAGGDGLEKVLQDVRWRIGDVREMLMTYRNWGDPGQRLYGCDEWSAPTVNLQTAINVIDAALASQAVGVKGE